MTKIKSLHKQVEVFHKLASYGDMAAFLEAIGQQPSLSGPTPLPPGTPKPTLKEFFAPSKAPQSLNEFIPSTLQTPSTYIGDVDKPAGTPPAQYPAISTETQDQLNQLLVPGGEIMPLKLDGKLGPKTQQAAQLFKQKYNKPATPANIKEEYLAAKHPELETKFPA